MIRKFVIISHQGAGTNLLRSLLNYHPAIFVDDEVFCNKEGVGQWKPGTPIVKFLDSVFAGKSGFTLMYNQMNPEIISYLKEKEIPIIHLIRDPARTIYKHLPTPESPVKMEELAKHTKYVKEKMAQVEAEGFKNIITISYEEITLGFDILPGRPVNNLHNLLSWIGVTPMPLRLTDKAVHIPLVKRWSLSS